MHSHFIDGTWTPACTGATLPVIDPATGQEFARIARGDAADIDRAVTAARRALAGPWGALTATERGRILTKMSSLILARAEEFAQLESRDTGKPVSQARNDIQVAARYCESINGYGAGGGVELPFGGVKKSGHGREKGFLALEEFCVVKTVVQYHGQ